MNDVDPTRRSLIGLLAASPALAALPVRANDTLLARPIPSSGLLIPCLGMGTWQTFSLSNAGDAEAVLSRFVELGGRVLDTSPMYGDAETAIGQIGERLGALDGLFLASKVWTRGRDAGEAQIERSFERLGRPVIDLMQVHNLLDWEVHLATLRRLRDAGRVRHIGITHYVDSEHARLARILERERLDFVQLNYNILARNAEREVLPVARDRGVAVIVNRPFQEGALFHRVRGRDLPPLAVALGCRSWAQFFLKFILGHPDVTCVIPATSKIHHLEDNMAAGVGALPSEDQRREMAAFMEGL